MLCAKYWCAEDSERPKHLYMVSVSVLIFDYARTGNVCAGPDVCGCGTCCCPLCIFVPNLHHTISCRFPKISYLYFWESRTLQRVSRRSGPLSDYYSVIQQSSRKRKSPAGVMMGRLLQFCRDTNCTASKTNVSQERIELCLV